jgi:hypothetical protein
MFNISKSETGTFVQRIFLRKRIEDNMTNEVRGDPFAGIGERQSDPSFVNVQVDTDTASRISKLQSIVLARC